MCRARLRSISRQANRRRLRSLGEPGTPNQSGSRMIFLSHCSKQVHTSVYSHTHGLKGHQRSKLKRMANHAWFGVYLFFWFQFTFLHGSIKTKVLFFHAKFNEPLPKLAPLSLSYWCHESVIPPLLEWWHGCDSGSSIRTAKSLESLQGINLSSCLVGLYWQPNLPSVEPVSKGQPMQCVFPIPLIPKWLGARQDVYWLLNGENR
jgi:hypothetical protein